MEILTKCAWVLLALVHAPPAAAVVNPQVLQRLYGLDPGGDIGLLMRL